MNVADAALVEVDATDTALVDVAVAIDVARTIDETGKGVDIAVNVVPQAHLIRHRCHCRR